MRICILANGAAMLEVKNITAGYGKRPIIKNISFTVADGEIACILGQNGSGKTTLLKAISKIMSASAGEVYISGESILEKPRKEIAQRLCVMSGLSSGYFSYTVFQTVLLSRYAHREKKFLTDVFSTADKQLVDEVLDKLKIAHLRNRFLTELSSGQLQKVFLARAIAQETSVLLLDEPTSHLDLKAQLEICTELQQITGEKNLSVLAVVHDINLALNFADRILLLKDGILVENAKRENFNLCTLNDIYETDVLTFMRNSLTRWQLHKS